MARMFGYYANQSDRVRCALSSEREVLLVGSDGANDGWGIGFYQGGEVLLRKRPVEARGKVDFVEITQELRTDLMIGHVRPAASGSPRAENTHPFRYRQWLFAQSGTIDRFVAVRPRLLDSIPDFLARNIRGETDSEHVFHLFLAFLYDSGKLEDPELDVNVAMDTLRTSVALLDRLVTEVGGHVGPLSLMATNGRLLLAARRGLSVGIVKRDGIRDCPVCRTPADRTHRDAKRIDHESLRYVLIASESPTLRAGWSEVSDGSIVGVRRDLQVRTAAL